MRIDVIGRNLEVTEALRMHAEEKANKLLKFFDGVQAVQFTLIKTDHHHKGLFEAELVIDVVKHDDFVIHCKSEDLYAAIDEAAHKGSRTLTDYKERLRAEKR